MEDWVLERGLCETPHFDHVMHAYRICLVNGMTCDQVHKEKVERKDVGIGDVWDLQVICERRETLALATGLSPGQPT